MATMTAPATLPATPPTLSPEDLKELNRLEQTEVQLLKERSELDARISAAKSDLEKARESHDAQCLALASGKAADVHKSAAEIVRLESLIVGLGKLFEMKMLEVRQESESLSALYTKRAVMEDQWKTACIEENIRVTREKVKELRDALDKAEIAAAAALRARVERRVG